jgi:putative ABC transport system substrate-binding protein
MRPSALAQAKVTPKRMAFLSPSTPASGDYLNRTLRAGLKELGWSDSALTVDTRYAEGNPSRAAALTDELLALRPDIFVSSIDLYARPAAKATKTVPIVFVLGFDPVGLGLVKSLAHPGGNATGFSVLNYELTGKRLALLKEALPRLDKVGALYREGDATAQAGLESLRKAGQAVGVSIVPIGIGGRNDIEAAVGRAAQTGLTAVMNVPDPLWFQERKAIADLCIRHRIAASFGAAEFADAGMLLGYGTDFAAVYRRAAPLIDRILRGADPATIAVEQANVYELAVNLKTARALGLEMPQSLMLQATRVIE